MRRLVQVGKRRVKQSMDALRRPKEVFVRACRLSLVSYEAPSAEPAAASKHLLAGSEQRSLIFNTVTFTLFTSYIV